ncbi:major facilitator superfamily domain-containing protein [Rhodotorula diobovata]|uniref:Major facilitator superfamily domain-containing protein n=1 Tax=Rhodotorula diobovata TaxID=5288 RepID=A0A5C5FZQ5_9BASI|nr:major facilitator superfamily domain-containing protein [Rhodotorula diobovata]
MSTRADDLLLTQPALHADATGFVDTEELRKGGISSDDTGADSYVDKSETSSVSGSRAPLAPRSEDAYTPGAAILNFLGLKKRKAAYDLDAVATQESVYDSPLAAYYQPTEKWENFAAFDPSERWTHREERAVRRKIDFRILAWVMLAFFALDIDRGNLGNATADNLLGDLGLTQADYNLGNTLSKLGFLTAELPSQMVGKRLGVDKWLPMQLVIFSTLAFCQFWMQGRASFLALRFLIAFFQGGFIPDMILYLSYYYTRLELPIRLAAFWSINYIADMCTAFLAVGLLKMRGVGGYAGWRWMFLIEGLFTLVIGIASFFMLPPGPSQTKAPWRKAGYFTDREVKIIVNKVARDDPTKVSMHNREALTPKLLWRSLCDYDLWPMYLIGLTFGIPGSPIKNYFQLSMKDLGFSTVMANLLSVPNTVLSVVNLVLLTCLSEIVNNRTWVCAIENLWFFPGYVALLCLPDPIKPWSYFALATYLLGFPYAHATQVAWTSRNAGSVSTRTVSASVYNILPGEHSVSPSGALFRTPALLERARGATQSPPHRSPATVIAFVDAGTDSPLVAQASDKPRYRKANSGILAVIVFNLVIVYPGTFVYYKMRNAWKAKRWNAMTTEEKADYLATTKDEGCRRLDFVFAT